MTRLHQIHEAVRHRAEETNAAHPDWPCRKGCDECCRRLAAVPRVTSDEWSLIADAIEALPAPAAAAIRRRIRDAASASRPVVCPLLDADAGTCLVYDARPVACRAYGFYAEREYVLGCSRIEAAAGQSPDVVWGNQETLEARLLVLGPAAEIFCWLE